MTKKMKAAFFSDDIDWMPEGHVVDKVYAGGRREMLAEMTDLYPEIITTQNFTEHLERIREIEVIFSTWGMPLLDAGYFRNSRVCVDAWHAEKSNNVIGPGNYGGRVSILGNGTISNELQKFLSAHRLEVVVVPSRAENRTLSLEDYQRFERGEDLMYSVQSNSL